jgi:hypothetical protein
VNTAAADAGIRQLGPEQRLQLLVATLDQILQAGMLLNAPENPAWADGSRL